MSDTEGVSPLEIKWEQFQKYENFREALRFADDREAFKKLVHLALTEGYELGKEDGAEEAAGKGAFGS